MILSVFSVRDRKAGMFNRPFLEINKAMALRGFQMDCMNSESLMHKFPDDYELCFLGTFNQESGVFQTLPREEILAEPRNFIQMQAAKPVSSVQ